jgi:hypothetical protein
MGAILNFFSAVKVFFESVLYLVKRIAELTIQFFRDPFGTILKVFIMLLGLVVAAFLGVWHTLLLPVVPAAAFVVANVAAATHATLTSLAYGLMWTLYFGVSLLVFVLDFFTGGYAFRLFLCEAEPDEWALRGNYCAGNRCARNLVCQRPCADRYRPVLGGAACGRTPAYQPTFCPQQHVYRRYVQASDEGYASHLGTSDAEDAAGAVFEERVAELPVELRFAGPKAKEAYLRRTYRDRKRFLSECLKPGSGAAGQAAEPVVRNLCSNVPLLFPAGSAPQVAAACRQMYCDFRYAPRDGTQPPGARPRLPHEREGFCNGALALAGDKAAAAGGAGASAPRPLTASGVQRIAVQSMVAVLLLMVLLSAQRVAGGQLFVPDSVNV